MDSIYQPGSYPRLIVIIPQDMADQLDLARKIHGLALTNGCEVIYLALLGPDEDSLSLSRSLVTLKAITSDDELAVYSKITPASTWQGALSEIYRPGDTLVYNAEQRISAGILRREPLGAVLAREYEAPLIELSGFYRPQIFQLKRLLYGLLTWLGFLVIVAGFSALEIQLDQGVHGAARTLMLMLTASLEIGAVFAWNNFSQR